MSVVLDASALLALLNSETGFQVVAELVPRSMISAVNLSEVIAKLAEGGMPELEIREALDGLDFEVIPFDSQQAYGAGLLRPGTRSAGLSFGDRACLTLGLRSGYPVVTTDREWATLDLGLEVRLVR